MDQNKLHNKPNMHNKHGKLHKKQTRRKLGISSNLSSIRKLGKNYKESKNFGYREKWTKTGLQNETSGISPGPKTAEELPGTSSNNTRLQRKGRNRGNIIRKSQLCIPIFWNSTKKQNSSNIRLTYTKLSDKKRTLQNGRVANSNLNPQRRRLFNKSGFKRCVLESRSSSRRQKIPSISPRRKILPVQKDAFRPVYSSTNIHENNASSHSTTERTGYSLSNLPRRHSSICTKRGGIRKNHKDNNSAFGKTRIPHQFQEISNNTDKKNRISGHGNRFANDDSENPFRKNKEDKSRNQENTESNKYPTQETSITSWPLNSNRTSLQTIPDKSEMSAIQHFRIRKTTGEMGEICTHIQFNKIRIRLVARPPGKVQRKEPIDSNRKLHANLH